MVNTMLVKVLTIIAVLVSCSSPQHDPTGDVTCYAPSVARGDPGHVTCNFNVDVSTQKRPISVKVVLYKIDNTEVEVLDCNLLQSSPVKCTLWEGYQSDKHIGEQLQVNITAASDEHVGRYVCSLMSNEMLPKSQPCNFRLEGSTWPTPAVTTQAEDKKDKGSTWPTPAVTTQAEDKKDKGSEQEEGAEKPWVIPVVTLVVLVIIIGVVVVLVRRRRGRCGGRCGGRSRQSTEEGDAEDALQADPGDEPDVETKSPQSTLTPESAPMLPSGLDTDCSGKTVQGEGADSDHREGEETPAQDVSQFTQEIKARAAGKQMGLQEMMKNKRPPFDTMDV